MTFEEETLVEIFKKRTGIDFNKNAHLKSEDFFSKKVNISPRELTCIFVDLEHFFNMAVSNEKILSKKFNKFDNLLNLVSENHK